MISASKYKGPWTALQVDDFLSKTKVPIRIAANGSSGYPVIASLWFVRAGDSIWCATQRSSSLAEILARNSQCGFEVSVESPPYRGVRGPATATLNDDRGEEVLRSVIERYLGNSSPKLAKTLLAGAKNETAILIKPLALNSWDYRGRMQEVV